MYWLLFLSIVMLGCGSLSDEAYITKVTPEEGSDVSPGTEITVKFNRTPVNLEIEGIVRSNWTQERNVVHLVIRSYRFGSSDWLEPGEVSRQVPVTLKWTTGKQIIEYNYIFPEELLSG